MDTFEQEVVLPNGSTFDHRETLEMIGYHKLGQFYKCDDEDALFYSLGQKRSPHFAKKLDADTKDYAITAEGDAYNMSWIANIKFRRWMRDTGFALDLNDLVEACAEYGSAVMKRSPGVDTKNDLNLCNLLYLWFDPTVEHIQDSPINELHLLTEAQIRKRKGWDNIEKALEQAERVLIEEEGKGNLGMVIDKYKIWERFGEFQKKDKKGKKQGDPKYYHTIFCGYGQEEVILFEEEVKPEDCPYYDFHTSKYEDRWLRMGVYERLFPLQRLVNELVNQNRQANAIASLLILTSRDKALIGRNATEEAFSGMILDAQSLAQVPIDNRFLSGFLAELMRYEIKADELCMTPEVVTGEKMPSGSTFRGQAILTNVANDAFKNARDRIHFNLSEVVRTQILPDLMKKWNSDDLLEISANEDEAKLFDFYALKAKVNEFISENWKRNRNPSPLEIEEFKQKLLERWEVEGRQLNLNKNFFRFKYALSFNPTGENVNKEQRNEVYSNVTSMLANLSPTGFVEILKKYLEDNGISPIKVPLSELQAAAAMQGGQGPQQTQQEKPDKLLSAVNN